MPMSGEPCVSDVLAGGRNADRQVLCDQGRGKDSRRREQSRAHGPLVE
jgi:hypothetical protein